MSWDTTVAISGFSASDVTDDDEETILKSLAESSDATDADDLEIVSITDSTARRARRQLLAEGVEVVYTTTLALEYTDYASADELFSAVVSDVETRCVCRVIISLLTPSSHQLPHNLSRVKPSPPHSLTPTSLLAHPPLPLASLLAASRTP